MVKEHIILMKIQKHHIVTEMKDNQRENVREMYANSGDVKKPRRNKERGGGKQHLGRWSCNQRNK